MNPRLTFSLLITLGATLGHLYLYRRLVRPLVTGRVGRAVVLAVVAAFTLLLLYRRELRALQGPWAEALQVAVYVWMGVAICLLVACFVADVLHAVQALVLRAPRGRRPALPAAGTDVPVDPDRRRLLTRGAAAAGALVGGSTVAAYGSWRAFAAPEVTEVALRIPKLPRALDGFSIVQLTDLHVGPFIQRRFMEELVARANALRPDLVAVTGDLVDGEVAVLGPYVAALQGLRSRHGTYFVTGNHDYSSGDVAWVAFLERLGVGVLRNRHVSIGDAGASFDLIGVDDWRGSRRTGRGWDLGRALEGRRPERAGVLLAHQPAGWDQAVARGVDVQVSGHTHGGQLFPGTALIGLAWEHTAGHYRQGDAHLYVSRGCGFWGPPMRVGSPPELVKLVLTT